VDQRPCTDQQDDGIEEVDVKGMQAMRMSGPEGLKDFEQTLGSQGPDDVDE